MKTRLVVFAIVMIVIMALGMFAALKPASAATFGPRIDQLLVKIYPSSSNEFTAFQAGDVDIIDTPLTSTLVPIINHTSGYALDPFSVLGVPQGYYAHRTILHVLNVDKYGIPSYFDLMCMNLPAVGITGGTVNFGFASDVQQLNVIYSTSAQDWQVLSGIYETLISYNPWNILIPMPWMASVWTIGSWNNPDTGNISTKVTYTLNSGINFINPVTGTIYAPVTTADIAFSLQYTYGQAGWNAPALSDCFMNTTTALWAEKSGYQIPFIKTTTNTVTVYFQNTNNWAVLQAGSIPIIPMGIFNTITDASGFYPGGDTNIAAMTGSGPFCFGSYSLGVSCFLFANRNFFKPIVPNVDTDPAHIHIDWGLFKSNIISPWTVNVLDIIQIAMRLNARGPYGGWIPEDCVKDGVVNVLDLILWMYANSMGATW